MTTTTRPRRSAVKPGTKPATTKPAARPSAKPAPARSRAGSPSSARVRGRRSGAARMPFVLVILGLLGGALVTLLLLNTVLAQDAFTLTELQRDNKQLTQQRQALQEEIAKEEAPQVLAQKARALGMRPAARPEFVDERTGKTTGREPGTHRDDVPPSVSAVQAGAGAGVARGQR